MTDCVGINVGRVAPFPLLIFLLRETSPPFFLLLSFSVPSLQEKKMVVCVLPPFRVALLCESGEFLFFPPFCVDCHVRVRSCT